MSPARVLSAAAVSTALTVSASACATGDFSEATALDVWIMEGTSPGAEAFFSEVSAEFEQQTGATVNVQFVPWADAHNKFVTAIAGGTMPDVAEVGTTWTPEFAQAGALADLTDRVGDTSGYVPGLLEAGTFEDRRYGVPWYVGVRAILYRTDVFADLGLDQPRDWDELRETATTIAEETDDMVAFPVPGNAEYSLLPFVWGAGGHIASQSDRGVWTSGIDSSESRAGITYFTDLALADKVSTTGATTWQETDIQDNFADGNVAMAIMGSWSPKAILADNPDLEGKLGSFAIPGPEGGYSPSFLGGAHLSVFNDSDAPDLSWQFVELLTRDDYALRWAEETTYFPGKQQQIDTFTETADPVLRPFATQMTEAGRGVPVTPAYGKLQGEKVLQTMVQSILAGDASVEAAAIAAADDIEQTLNEDP
ncbi:sugar ABC transporter substrate-binding protein [Salinactinospora qingdaonensis]|uniref:Sugar ABC transporter substrate-binding protein n=1 Tax=Salinactinospora qingdaonensis TaxID=702744 RepID=A0ABP7EXT8_9ACTN